MHEVVDYLKELMKKQKFDDKLFRITLEEGSYILGGAPPQNSDKIDFFEIGTLYEGICNISEMIRFSFEATCECITEEFPTLDAEIEQCCNNMFSYTSTSTKNADYYLENMVYRTVTLWDLLAQLCNLFFMTGVSVDRIYVKRYFSNNSKIENNSNKEFSFCEKVHNYILEENEQKKELLPYKGNYQFVCEFRNNMTHRLSLTTSTFSKNFMNIRNPTSLTLKRVTEDYIEATKFIEELVAEIYKEFKKTPLGELQGEN